MNLPSTIPLIGYMPLNNYPLNNNQNMMTFPSNSMLMNPFLSTASSMMIPSMMSLPITGSGLMPPNMPQSMAMMRYGMNNQAKIEGYTTKLYPIFSP